MVESGRPAVSSVDAQDRASTAPTALLRATPRAWLVTLAALGWLASACASSAPAHETPAPAPQAPPSLAELLPLTDDTVLSYETTSDTGETGLLVFNVRRPRPDLAELDVAGRVQRLDVQSTGVSLRTGGYLLRAPIAAGATFQGSFGVVTITELGRRVTLPAGTFERCVVTVEESQRPFKRAQSTYCPGVGLVELIIEGETGEDIGRVESRLKSYGKRVVLPG